jgi:glycogen debranching enzyme
VRRELLTPMGLRTLAPGDANYHGRYEGGPRERDGAYHQGTVWPWLIGPFVRAFLQVNPESRAEARAFINPLLAFMQDRGLGQLPEIADGDAPHEPRGCIAQAWSVAEVLRVLVE